MPLLASAKIISINASKIVAGLLRSVNWGTDAGTEIDLDTGTIKVGGSVDPKLSWDGTNLTIKGQHDFDNGPPGTAGDGSVAIDGSGVTVTNTDGSYSKLVSDTVAFFEAGSEVPSHYVRRAAMGTASNGDWVSLDWKYSPKVVVSVKEAVTWSREHDHGTQYLRTYITPNPPGPEGFYTFIETVQPGELTTIVSSPVIPLEAPEFWESEWSNKVITYFQFSLR